MAAPVLLLAARLTVAQGDLTVGLGALRAGPAGHRGRGCAARLAARDHRDRGRGGAVGRPARGRPASWSPTGWRRSPAPTRRCSAARWSRSACAHWRTRRSSQRDHQSRTPARRRPRASCWRRWPTSGRCPARRPAGDGRARPALRRRAGPARPQPSPPALGGRGRGLGRRSAGRCPRRTRAGARRRPCCRVRRRRRVDRGAALGPHGRPAARRRPAGRGARGPGAVVPRGPAARRTAESRRRGADARRSRPTR